MIAVDSSVVVAAFASWHEGHRAANGALAEHPLLPAHAAVESFSVLTRLPPPHRAPAELVAAFLEARFPAPWLLLGADAHRHLLSTASRLRLTGGAVYDALIAATASEHGATLLSRDHRAATTYELLGSRFELLT